MRVFVDIETRSRTDIRKSNVYRYVEDEDFRILMMAYAVGDGPVEVQTDPQEITQLIQDWIRDGVTIVAHNAAFERVCFSEHLRRHAGYGPGYLEPEMFDDSMALAAVHGYPAKLDTLARWLGGQKKDEAGGHLIRWFYSPNRKVGFNPPEDSPEKWEDFKRYCAQDVETHRDAYKRLPSWPAEEYRVWVEDQLINDRGIRADTQMASAAVTASEDNRLEHELEFSALTGVVNPGSTQQVMRWLKDSGLPLPNLQKATISEALQQGDLPPTHRRALELRRELALVASKKYIAALDRVNFDGRLRGSFHYFGAHTGRWAGRGVQLQNLPSDTITPEDGEDLDTAIEAQAVDVALGNRATPHVLKALVRSMLVGPFTVVDYSAIEARVLAWVCGESWALDAFQGGRDIYVETAQRMGGLSRKEGKVATLALGYNGGVGSLRAMGAEGSDAHLQHLVDQWRGANPKIAAYWRHLDEVFWTGGRAGKVYVSRSGSTRRIHLPSGRAITYHGVRRTNQVNRWGNVSPQLSFRDPKKGLNGRTDTYGGRLTENITQAIARDVLADALRALGVRGYRVVGHVHDEVIVEGAYPVHEVADVMTTASPWAEGLPLDAEGFQCPRYRKG